MEIRQASDLVIWKTKIAGQGQVIFVPIEDHPNPMIDADSAYVSVFSAKEVIALNKHSGAILWRLSLNDLSSVYPRLHGGFLFCGTSNELLCVEPKTGNVQWIFCPYGLDGEQMYSGPTFLDDRVFIGDRNGFLHCLALETGASLWKAQTGEKGQQNAVHAVEGNTIYVVNNAGLLVAIEARSGKILWSVSTEGATIYRPILRKDRVLTYSSEQLTSVSKENRQVIDSERLTTISAQRWLEIDGLFYVLDSVSTSDEKDEGKGTYEFRAYKDGRLIHTHSFGQGVYTSGMVRVPSRNLICIVGFQGLYFYSIDQQDFSFQLDCSETLFAMPSTPFFEDDKCYFTTGDGFLACVRMLL